MSDPFVNCSVLDMRDIAHLPGEPCLLSRGTRLGGVAFYHVYGSCRAIPPNRDEVNLKNMAAQGEFFRCYHITL